MSRNSRHSSVQLKRYIASAHPYAFDALFHAGKKWCGSGRVTLCDKGGGVNQAWALVETDLTGYRALKSAGFALRSTRQSRRTGAAARRSARKA